MARHQTESLTFVGADLPQVHHVALVADERYGRLWRNRLPDLPHEVEGLSVRDGVHQQATVGPLQRLIRWQLVLALKIISPK